MGLIDEIKTQVKKSGTNKAKFVYFKSGSKVRIRFLSDMEEGFKVSFHDSFQLSINVPCQEAFGRTCEHCENEDLRHRDQFAWSVWDYEANEVKVLMGPVNNFSPIPQLVAMYDNYGTITDRDYLITQNGSQQNKSYTVVPMDKVKFRNEKAKPLSKSKLLDLLDKGFPNDGEKSSNSGRSKPENEDNDYESKTAKKLYELCKEREIEVDARQPKEYYIEKLEQADAAEDDDWGDDEKPDYASMSAKELYDMCIERGIDAERKKSKEYYTKKLQDDDSKAEDGWGEDEKEDEEW